MMKFALLFGLFIFSGVPAGAQQPAQSQGLEFVSMIADQFSTDAPPISVTKYLEYLKSERFGAGTSLELDKVRALNVDQLGELVRFPVDEQTRARINYGYVYAKLLNGDRLGAALAAQASGTDEWVAIVTDMSANPRELEQLANTEDLAKALGMMSQVRFGELGETQLTNVTLDLARGQTNWRVGGIDYELPIQNTPVVEIMKWTSAADIPALLAAYEPETPQAWSIIFDQYDMTDKLYSDVDWTDLLNQAIEHGTYAQLDRLMETDPTLRWLLPFDRTPEARIAYLESSPMNAFGHVELGNLYLDQDNDAESAAESFKLALESDSGYLPARVGLARIALSPWADQIEDLPNTEEALRILRTGQAAGLYEASFALATADILPPEQRVLASVIAQEQADTRADSVDARRAQSSNCRAAAASGDGPIKCQFFDIAYITNREPVSDGSMLVDFGTSLVGYNDMSVGILRNDIAIVQPMPDGQPGIFGWLSCAGLGVCLPTEILRPEASDTGFEGIAIQHDGTLEHRISASFDHFSEGYRDPNRALVFIHGFNTDFREAVDTLTNLMITARYPSTPFLLSWPSEGRLWDKNLDIRKIERLQESLGTNYPHDRNMVTASCLTMHAALSAVIDRYGAGNVDLLIHSMGNQLFYEMLNGCDGAQLSWPTEDGAPFRFLILSAPDVAMSNFKSALNAYTRHAERTFIYGTDNDLVLEVSGYINQNVGDRTSDYVNRLGYFDIPPVDSNRINWINTIMIDGASQHAPLNHSHYVNTAPVRRDIAMILNGHDHDGAERCVFPADGSDVFYYISPNCL